MAKTKNTPRTSVQTICPVCKNGIKPDEKFEEHVIKCSKSREECKECGQTFRKRAYLVKHQRTQHQSVVPSTSAAATADNVIDSSTSDESDWDNNEPDITLAEEESVEEIKESPSMTSLIAGRIIRKATKPEIPLAPQKRNPDDDSDDGAVSEMKKRRKAEATDITESGQLEKTAGGTASEEVEPRCEKQKMKDVVVACQKSSAEQIIEVKEDGEIMYRNSIINRRIKQDGETKFCLGDLIPEGNIRSTNMEVCAKEGQVELRFKYNPDK